MTAPRRKTPLTRRLGRAGAGPAEACPDDQGTRPPTTPSPVVAARCATLNEAAAYAGGSSPAASAWVFPSAAFVAINELLRDGEIVLLILKPSRWYLLLNSFRFTVGVAVLLCAMQAAHAQNIRNYVDIGLFAVSIRVMWTVLKWMGQIYILTDRRIVRVSGVFHVDLFDCPLRKVGRTNIVRSIGEQIFRIGSIEIYPCNEAQGAGVWQMVGRPEHARKQIEAAIRRAKQCG